jgi:hypothetical protein
MVKFYASWLSSLCWLAILLGNQINATAQSPKFCDTDNVSEESGFIVRSVKIEGNWVPQALKEKIQKVVEVGKPYSTSVANRARKVIQTELKLEQQPIDSSNVVSEIKYGTTVVDACNIYNVERPQQVDVIFYPYYVRISLVRVGDNVIPIPTIKTPAFSAQIPSPVLTKNPILSISTDRSFGTSVSLKTTANLLNRSPVGGASQNENRQTDRQADILNADLDARRSIDRPFYNINTGFEYIRPDRDGSITPNVSIRYANQFTPLGEGENWQERLQIQGGIEQKLTGSVIKAYTIGGGLRFLDNSDRPRNFNVTNNSETGFQLYAVGDSRIGDGFARFGAWIDGGFPNKGSSYQRAAIQAGYSTELGAGHDTIGLEMMAGSGYAWGNPPEYSRFYGGYSPANFLYESLNSTRVKAVPAGPVLRSFGERQAGIRGANGLVRGGDFYWNLNFNLTFPIAGWSQPLIPNEVVQDVDDTAILLPDLIKRTVAIGRKSSIGEMKKNLINRGYPDNEETAAKAAINFDNEITPTINYLTDRANLYSIKPILLFDLAQISGNDGGSKVWAGVGGGVQMNVVNGRLETGYMQTIAPATDSSNGNFFLRFLFQDFF